MKVKKINIKGHIYLEIPSPKPEEEIILTEDEITTIKTGLENKDVEIITDKDLKKLLELKTKASHNSLLLGMLFIDCYDNLISIANLSLEKANANRLQKLLDTFDIIDYLRSLLEDYGDGSEIGSYYAGEKIKDIVKQHRTKISNFVQLFFKFIGDEE